jgi:hypothetical protein
MTPYPNRSITLMELLIAIVLMTLIVLAFANIDLFSRFHVLTADRRAKVQNEVSYVLEHMTKEIGKAIGDINNPAVDTTTDIQGDPAIIAWVDGNPYAVPPVSPNGRREVYPNDHRIAYRFTTETGAPGTRTQIWYYANCVGPNCNQAGTVGPEVIATRIYAGDWNPSYNNVFVEITGRWDPDPAQQPSPDNPAITMRTRINMPSVSTN